MAAAGQEGEDARLYDTVEAVSELSQQLGISIHGWQGFLVKRAEKVDADALKDKIKELEEANKAAKAQAVEQLNC